MSKKLLRTSMMVGMATMISRLLGFVRDVLFAMLFGAHGAYDAFVIAFKLPNFMRRLFGEGAFSQAFVPVLVHHQSHKNEEEVHHFVGSVGTLLAFALIVVVILAECFTPQLIQIFAPGFGTHTPRYYQAIQLLHWTAPYLFFIAMVAFASAIVNTYKRFFLAAIAPVLLNLCFISAVGLGFYLHYKHIILLAYAVLMAGVLQCAFLWIGLYRLKMLPRFQWRCWQDEGVRRVLRLMVPALFGVSVAQIGILIDNIFASFLPVGNISSLYYSDRLTYLPLGVIGVALSTVVLPHLSGHASKEKPKAFSDTLDWALRVILVAGLPAAIGLGFLAMPIITTLLYHGAFNAHAVHLTTHALMAFSVGLPGFMLIKTGASGFYARQKMSTVVRIAVFAVVVNIILNAAFIEPLGNAGLALATALASTLNAACLWVLLMRRQVLTLRPQTKRIVLMILLASVIMAASLYFLSGNWDHWLQLSSFVRIGRLFITIIAGVVVYAAVLLLLGVRRHHFYSPTTEENEKGEACN
jgi:putative peptidoglycan lipid II flippase